MINNMYKYFIFVIFGIILYLLLNSNDGFSVGVPEYLFYVLDNDHITISPIFYDDTKQMQNMIISELSYVNVIMGEDENTYYVHGDNHDDARRNYDTYIATRQSRQSTPCSIASGSRPLPQRPLPPLPQRPLPPLPQRPLPQRPLPQRPLPQRPTPGPGDDHL